MHPLKKNYPTFETLYFDKCDMHHLIGNKLLESHDLSEVYNIAKNIDANVISLIGVLEHVQHPNKMLDSLRKNKNVKYLFISGRLIVCRNL